MPKSRALGYTEFYKGSSTPLNSTTRTPTSRTVTPAFRSRVEDEEENRKKQAIKRRLQLRTR